MSAEVDRWLAMLDERADECLATLARDRLALEVVFRERRDDAEGDWLYWFEITLEGDDPIAEDVPEADRRPIDHDHVDFTRRCKEPGHVDAEPALVLIPRPWSTPSVPGS